MLPENRLYPGYSTFLEAMRVEAHERSEVFARACLKLFRELPKESREQWRKAEEHAMAELEKQVAQQAGHETMH